MNNLSVAESHWPSAVIAGAFQTGVVGVRNLFKHGVKTVCFDSDSGLQGFHSKYGPARLCPDPDLYPDDWIEFMHRLSIELGDCPVLIPSSDQYVIAIHTHRNSLDPYYRLSPGIDLQGQLALKQTQYRLAMEHGMPMPYTNIIDSRKNMLDFAAEARYPSILKPWHFRDWRKLPKSHPLLRAKVAVAENEQQLLAYYDSVSEFTPNLVAQEVILGEDTNCRVYLGCYNHSGNRIAHAMFRELRCVPMGYGPASISEPVIDEETDRVCNDFLIKLGYRGICEIEAKVDDRDGQVKLVEANPRLSGGGDAAPYDGVNLIWLHYLDMIGQEVHPVKPSGKRFQHIVLRAEAVAIPAYMRAGKLGWRDLLRSYKPPLAFFDLDIRDWKLSLETFLVFLRVLVTQIFKKN